MSEETIIDKTVVKGKPQQKKVEAKQSEPKQSESKQADPKKEMLISLSKPKKIGESKKIIGASTLAASAGVVVGLLTPVQVFPQTSDVEAEANEGHGTFAYDHPEDGQMEVATSVDDSMTFSEAFAAARHEVGPGGLFTWHGHTYGTFYAEEWNAMSAEDKEQYWADVHATTSHLNETAIEDEDLADIVGDELMDNGDIPSEPQDGWGDEGEVVDSSDDIASAEIINDEESVDILDSIEGDNSDILLDGSQEVAIDDTMDEGCIENPDVDLLASNFENPDIPIDNDMDMSDFA